MKFHDVEDTGKMALKKFSRLGSRKLKTANQNLMNYHEVLIQFCKPKDMPNDDFIYWNQFLGYDSVKIEVDGILYFDFFKICKKINEKQDFLDLYNYILSVMKVFC